MAAQEKTDPWGIHLPLLREEMTAFEQQLRNEFTGGSFIQAAAYDLIAGGGKRLRPALVIAAAHLGTYRRETVFPVAMAIESIHTATLVHDDVIDYADTRRGETTLHNRHGNHIAIYTGDYLLARGIRQIVRSGLQLKELARLAEAVELICTGEVSQYLGRNKIPGFRTYLRRIMSKTGILFAAACSAGGYCAELPEEQVRRLWHFGMRYGAAFQIRDDLIDMETENQADGKPTGRDLVEGVITLPVLFAAADDDFRKVLEQFLSGNRNQQQVKELVRLSRQLGALEQTRQVLQQQISRCETLLSDLPAGSGHDMLASLLGRLNQK